MRYNPKARLDSSQVQWRDGGPRGMGSHGLANGISHYANFGISRFGYMHEGEQSHLLRLQALKRRLSRRGN